jgi:hypothetical protein
MRGKFRIRRPSAAIVISVIALVFALAGGAVAAKKLSLGALSDGAKNKTVGVGKLTYVTTTVTDPNGGDGVDAVANCPAGLKVIGGGIKATDGDVDFIADSYPTTTGWKGHVFTGGPVPHTFTTTAICANSRAVTGAPPSS